MSRRSCPVVHRYFSSLEGVPQRLFLLVILVLIPVLAGWSKAAIGEPPADLLADLEGYQPRETGADTYLAADDFEFELELRSGLVYGISGSGLLNERNVSFMAELIATATGYGASIEGPVADFLATRLGELSGRGEATLGVEQYHLVLDVSGGAEPYEVAFALALQQVPAEAFPEASHTLGPSDARYVVREFSDFQCPYCAGFASQLLPLLKERLLARGDVRFEYHHFPLANIHPNAAPAAEAAECVAAVNRPEDFWPFHDALFERQQSWGSLGDPQPYFVRLAAELDLDSAGVAECLDEGRFRSEVAAAFSFATTELGLTGTPSLFVNGYKVQDYLDLQAYLDLIELVDAFANE